MVPAFQYCEDPYSLNVDQGFLVKRIQSESGPKHRFIQSVAKYRYVGTGTVRYRYVLSPSAEHLLYTVPYVILTCCPQCCGSGIQHFK
jgi:hypothetical protein